MVVVEGLDDQHFIWNLCEKIDFKPVFEVKEMGGFENALNYFSTDIKNQKQPFGLILDADQNLEFRKSEIKNKLSRYFIIPRLVRRIGYSTRRQGKIWYLALA
jgi:hypothetical protein